MKKVILVSFVCLALIFIAYFVKSITEKNSNSISNLFSILNKNEGIKYPKQKINFHNFPSLSAKAYLAMYEGEYGRRYLVIHNANQVLPIASITKIATAMVALEGPESYLFQFSQDSIGVGTKDRYLVGDVLTSKELIKSILIESDNDAARVICENQKLNFVVKMNSFAKSSKADSTKFYNCTGLDMEGGGVNVSTAYDVSEIMSTFVKKHPELVDIMSMPSSNIFRMDNTIHHTALSTYEFIQQDLPFQIIGGKTGQTDIAKQNLVLAIQAPKGILYLVVLGSDDRVSDMKNLASYIKDSFGW